MIREATEQDLQPIQDVCLDAFESDEREVVAKLAIDIIADESSRPVVALVAEDDGAVVGMVIFSRVSIQEHSKTQCFILAPLAVSGASQRRGIGGLLIAEGMKRLREYGVEFVFVLGDPRYYTRHGFRADHGFIAPYPLEYPEAWMVRTVGDTAPAVDSGHIRCCRTLDVKELW